MKSCSVTGYPSEQDGAIFPATDLSLHCVPKENSVVLPYRKSFIDQACAVNLDDWMLASFFCASMDRDGVRVEAQ